jgi:glyoxylase-like metal-dependent hydrolase (beta-lactamase superfamily II)
MFKRALKRALLMIVIVLVVAIALLGYTFLPATLDVTAYRPDPFAEAPSMGQPDSPEVSLSLIKCGKMMSRQSFVFLGGSWSENYDSGMAALLIQHPQGTLLFDAGFGANVDEHFKSMPALMKALTTYDKETNAAQQLQQHGIPPQRINRIVLSHSHWDHVSGAEDFPDAEVLVARAEEEYIQDLPSSELMSKMRDKLKLRSFEFSGGAYENFDRSFDLFGDRSLVLVPLPGHTPGSTGLFVNLRSGRRFFFIGDLTWAIEGVKLPAERPWICRKLVDLDEEEVRRSIVKVHQLLDRHPDLVVVPAHDRRVHDQLPQFPESVR